MNNSSSVPYSQRPCTIDFNLPSSMTLAWTIQSLLIKLDYGLVAWAFYEYCEFCKLIQFYIYLVVICTLNGLDWEFTSTLASVHGFDTSPSPSSGLRHVVVLLFSDCRSTLNSSLSLMKYQNVIQNGLSDTSVGVTSSIPPPILIE